MIAPRVATPSPKFRLADPPSQTREDMIRTTAYLLAERRGFDPGHELEDWLAAEQQVDSWLANRGPPRRYRPR